MNQLAARIKRSSKYWGQSRPYQWFDVQVVHDSAYHLRGNNNNYRLNDVILGARLDAGVVNLVSGKISTALVETDSTVEVARLRREQSQAVMPLIGPLLDAWDSIPNDEKFAAELLILRHHIEEIRASMET